MKIGVGFWFWVPKLVTADAALASWQVGRFPRFSSPSTPKDLADAMRKMGDVRPQDGLKMWETQQPPKKRC